MAGVNEGVIWQGEQFFADGGEELLVVAARKVGAADAALKKGVATKNGFVLREIKSEGVGRVAGDMEEGDFF